MENITQAIADSAQAQRDMEAGRAGWDRSEYGDGGYESGFSQGGVEAWHGLSTVYLEDDVDTDTAIERSTLGWDVVATPLNKLIPSAPGGERFVVNTRSTDGRVLGVVGQGYKTVQNRDKFRFMDELLGGAARWVTGGSLGNGAQVFLLAKITREIVIAGLDSEAVDAYLLCSDGHDGRTSLNVSVTGVRVQCRNANNLALKSAPRKWTLRHTSSIEGRLQQARQTLGLTYKYLDGLEELGNQLVAQKMTRREFERFLNGLVEFVPPKGDEGGRKAKNREAAREAVTGVYLNKPDLQPIAGTKWAALQAVVDWDDHLRPVRETRTREAAEQRFIRMTGFNQQSDAGTLKTRAMELLVK